MASQAVGWGACINHREMEKEDLKLENSPAFRHSIPVQMRFNDADVLGHINNSVYFSYYDLGKTAYFTAIRKTGIDWSRPDLVAANINCNFYSPMYFGEPVSVVKNGLPVPHDTMATSPRCIASMAFHLL